MARMTARRLRDGVAMSNVIHTPLAEIVIASAIAVHRVLGPGLLESTYERCLAFELTERGVPFETQVALPVVYRGHTLDCGYRADLRIARDLIVEVKSAERFLPIHTAQAMTYLRLSGASQVLLLNFNVEIMKNGIKSFLRPPAL